jgi:hypothetical protein
MDVSPGGVGAHYAGYCDQGSGAESGYLCIFHQYTEEGPHASTAPTPHHHAHTLSSRALTCVLPNRNVGVSRREGDAWSHAKQRLRLAARFVIVGQEVSDGFTELYSLLQAGKVQPRRNADVICTLRNSNLRRVENINADGLWLCGSEDA